MRTLTYASALITLAYSTLDLFQIYRYNIAWGIPDMTILCITSIIESAIEMSLSHLPCMVMFQKMTPPHVEATMMAFSASVMNLSNGLVGQLIGVFINKHFVGVTEKDLSNFSKLAWISIFFGIYKLFVIRFIPKMAEIKATIEVRQEQRNSIARRMSTAQKQPIEVPEEDLNEWVVLNK